ncbi:expressed unknown protein [Seminavis robusta]|uniref:Uncharacterized protein n=1 Tax=Seminavis robusta TaxID=568900 RepID=A0A9N8DA14_9STRA|nr:expressed unknown protein [Seminavis robusta]|eukprot:Sro12_g009110.1 n/a (444) ;mRNA; r:18000-19331
MPRRKLRLKLKPITTPSSSNDQVSDPQSQAPPSTPGRRTRRSGNGQSHSLVELETMIQEKHLTYPGWDDDVREFRALHERYYGHPQQGENSSFSHQDTILGDWVLASRLQGMQHKQQAYVGDRSHSYVKALDALVVHLSYPGWPQDFQLALQSHYQHDNDSNRQKALFRMQQRQAVFKGDRSHPRLVELDQIATSLTYPGHARDFRQCEQLHFEYTDDYIGNNVLTRQFQSLRNRQAHWDGTLACKELESLRSQLTYDGWQEDIHTAMEAHLQPCSILESSGHVMDSTTALHHVQHKQSVLADRDRSHPRLVALDQLLLQLEPDYLTNTPQCQQLVQELEQVHLRYSTDDWVGNAIYERLLQALRRHLKAQTPNGSMPSTPCKNGIFVEKKANNKIGSPSSIVTASTISASWSRDSDDICEDDTIMDDGTQQTGNLRLLTSSS